MHDEHERAMMAPDPQQLQYEQLKELRQVNRSLKVIRQWVTVMGVLAALVLLAVLIWIFVPILTAGMYS